MCVCVCVGVGVGRGWQRDGGSSFQSQNKRGSRRRKTRAAATRTAERRCCCSHHACRIPMAPGSCPALMSVHPYSSCRCRAAAAAAVTDTCSLPICQRAYLPACLRACLPAAAAAHCCPLRSGLHGGAGGKGVRGQHRRLRQPVPVRACMRACVRASVHVCAYWGPSSSHPPCPRHQSPVLRRSSPPPAYRMPVAVLLNFLRLANAMHFLVAGR